MGRYVAACQAFVSGVKDGSVWHLGDLETTNQVGAAGAKAYGDGWLWTGRSGDDVSALRAATVAAWVADLCPVTESAYANADSGLMTV